MVRLDDVDPGGWAGVSPAKLLAPLDVHIHRVALKMGWTRRKQADAEAALEVTRAWRQVCPTDPVRFDFSVSRASMRRQC